MPYQGLLLGRHTDDLTNVTNLNTVSPFVCLGSATYVESRWLDYLQRFRQRLEKTSLPA